jgi:RimJ/RimL family protein N-acetyltransferase
MTTKFIDLGNVYLAPLVPIYAGKLASWANDPNTTWYLFTGRLPTTTAEWEDTIKADLGDDSCVVLGIFFVTDTRTVHFIGSVGFYQIDQIGRTAEYRIFIGDRDYWGQGLGTKVTKAMVHYGFDRLNLVYANAGFLYEGTLRARIYRNGRYYDAVAMSILRSEECLKQESLDLDVSELASLPIPSVG